MDTTNLLTTEEAAVELGVSARRVLALIKDGRLKSKTVGVAPRITHLIKREDLEAVRIRKPGRPPKEPPAPDKAQPAKKRKGKPS